MPALFRVIVPLLLMFPPTVRFVAFAIDTESPALLSVSVPMVKLWSDVVAAVVKLIRMFSPVVIAPLFQLVPRLQLPLVPPCQVSVVTGGGALLFAGCVLAPATGWPCSAFCESLPFEAVPD